MKEIDMSLLEQINILMSFLNYGLHKLLVVKLKKN